MIRTNALPVAFLCLIATGSDLCAQAPRYELGRRLRVFESLWEKTPGEASRKVTVAPLNQAVSAFFTLRLNEAARSIDEARFALDASAQPTPARRWAESLAVFPSTRLVDGNQHEISIELKSFYEVARPAEVKFSLRVVLSVDGKESATQSLPIVEVPMTCKLPVKNIKEGDHWLRYEIVQEKDKLAQGSLQISFVNKLADRVARLKKVKGDGAEIATESATLRETLRLLDKWMDGKTEETDYPIFKLIRDVEATAESIQAGKPFFTKARSGECWLSLAVQPEPKSTQRVFPMRVLTPAKWNDQAPPPLVIALHGAGGSENMFFEGYGNGKIVRLCQERGWMLVAPRIGFNLPLADVLEELHKRWPFDRKSVFLVGHSMGAAQSLQSVGSDPKRYAGVVALGGSGTVKASEDLKKVPFYIGVGSQDFALSGARGLRDRLAKVGVATVTFRELADVEHLGIVQQSLGETFVFFDEVAATRRAK